MDSYQTMEWNAKWECENLEFFCSKYNGTPKKLQMTDWVIEEGGTDAGPSNLSGGSGCSASDFGHISSAKSTISASTECSSKEGFRASNLNFDSFGGFSADFNKNEFQGAATPSPSVDTSVGSAELSIGLKLGKRTYFENSSAGNNSKTSSFSKIPVSSTSTTKKRRPHCENAPILRCQVEACNLDLSSAKEYHRKHRVCESHSKCSKVIVGGLERRFCQQCSRFHGLSEFDEKKRSCRRRLSDHNARRRKPQNETVMSSIYEGRQQMSFVSSNATMSKTRPAGISNWESLHTCNYELPTATGYVLKPEICSPVDVQSHLPWSQLPSATNIPNQSSSRLLQCKGNLEGLSQGYQESMFPSTDLHRALSLLSTNSRGSCDQESVNLNHSISATYKNIPYRVVHAVPQGLPAASPECWQTEVQSSDTCTQALVATNNSGGNYQEIQHFSAPHRAGSFNY